MSLWHSLTCEGSNNSDLPGQENVGGDDCQLSVIPSQAKGEPMLLTILTWLPLRPRQTTRPPLMIIPRLSLLPHRQKKNNSTHLMQRIEEASP
jgi:hypothetical protein